MLRKTQANLDSKQFKHVTLKQGFIFFLDANLTDTRFLTRAMLWQK